MRRAFSCLTIALVLLALSSHAYAQPTVDPDTEVARRHFEQGSALYQQGRYADAIREFEAANQIKPLPDFEYNIARCYDRLEDLDQAIAHYQTFVKEAGPSAASTDAPARIAVLKERLASRAQAQPAKFSPVQATPSREAPKAAPERRRIGLAAPVAVGAVAAASLATGLGLYLGVGPSYDELARTCAPRCAPSQWQGLQTEERAGIALLIVGGAAAAADLALWIVYARSGHHSLRALAPSAGALVVRF